MNHQVKQTAHVCNLTHHISQGASYSFGTLLNSLLKHPIKLLIFIIQAKNNSRIL